MLQLRAISTRCLVALPHCPAVLRSAKPWPQAFPQTSVNCKPVGTFVVRGAAAMAGSAEQVSANKMFGGQNKRFKHDSAVLGCSMNFTVYFPPTANQGKAPVLFWLSGLTCTDENFIQKSGAQRKAAELGIALVAADTSPRGLGVEGEADESDFGVGAGFYLNATVPKWKNWRMYDYITKELPGVLKEFDELDLDKVGISGHSMGGHGALTIGMKNPSIYKSISAFSPISSPSQVPWGQKALSGYLGDDKEAWKEYDATELVKGYSGPKLQPILIDVGTADPFLEKQLKPEIFTDAAKSSGIDVNNRLQDGYDHSYYFIATFIDDHVEHFAKALRA